MDTALNPCVVLALGNTVNHQDGLLIIINKMCNVFHFEVAVQLLV